MQKSLIKLTSAMNGANITLEADDIKGLIDVSKDNNRGNTKVFTTTCGNLYVTEEYSLVLEAKELSMGISNG